MSYTMKLLTTTTTMQFITMSQKNSMPVMRILIITLIRKNLKKN